jgi:ATP-dependent helicase/nuclease subunit B|tara:strand:- start:8439 stop:10943 length:2505 start_codon:yes stop_codon:yes gene_type:complete
MRVSLDLSSIKANDTIIVANNRQVLAIKKSISELKGTSKMPKVSSYKSWLEDYWNQNSPSRSTRLLTQFELRFLLKEISKDEVTSNPETFIDELIKSYTICKTYFIEISELSSFGASPPRLFIDWIRKYDKFKKDHNCIDHSDLFSDSLESLKVHNKNGKYYCYGFNEPTPEQQKLFEILECTPLLQKNENTNIPAYSFIDQETELKTIAKWAKEISIKNPDKKIGIVIPNLNELQHIVKTTFDLEFASTLIETHQKPYNISLGIPLGQYPLIQHLFSILKISTQFMRGYIDHELLIKVVTSPYIKDASKELDGRALLINKVLKIGASESKVNKIISLLDSCPSLKEIFIGINTVNISKTTSLDGTLNSINLLLTYWGFTSDRILSSSEYQIFEKYQIESLILNKLSVFYKKSNLFDALEILNAHINAVIFQPKSGLSNIHILGSLEAEGIFFDHAWVSSMTSNFLPGRIKMPLFIPQKTAIEYELPNTSFLLVAKESKKTLENLNNLSFDTIYSYPKNSSNREELPTPYLDFDDYLYEELSQGLSREMEYIKDSSAPKIDEPSIKKGVKTLQNQMSCGFKGFTSRLSIDNFDEPHIGISRLEQGNLIHKILETFFNETTTSTKLLELSDNELTHLIEKHTESAILKIPQSNFKVNEKNRLLRIIHEYISLEKERDYFEVVETESASEVNIEGLKFSTRIDRMDRMSSGSKIIIDYKTGKNVKASHLTGDPLEQAQLPIYAITNSVQGVAFAIINSNNCEFKAITKNKLELPLSKQASNKMPDWDKQVTEWRSSLTLASQDFQAGVASVLPTKHACDYCDYDLLCRIEKPGNNR